MQELDLFTTDPRLETTQENLESFLETTLQASQVELPKEDTTADPRFQRIEELSKGYKEKLQQVESLEKSLHSLWVDLRKQVYEYAARPEKTDWASILTKKTIKDAEIILKEDIALSIPEDFYEKALQIETPEKEEYGNKYDEYKIDSEAQILREWDTAKIIKAWDLKFGNLEESHWKQSLKSAKNFLMQYRLTQELIQTEVEEKGSITFGCYFHQEHFFHKNKIRMAMNGYQEIVGLKNLLRCFEYVLGESPSKADWLYLPDPIQGVERNEDIEKGNMFKTHELPRNPSIKNLRIYKDGKVCIKFHSKETGQKALTEIFHGI